jgi:hypothetical protein
LTQPGFSSRRNKDVALLIKEITRRLRIRSDSTTFSEQEGLRLKLERYLKQDDLVVRLEAYDSLLVGYYAHTEVSFCADDSFNLRDSDDPLLMDHVSNRIYNTRNAVVHSKDGDKSQYVPFEDDVQLAREVPLIRCVSEDVIINTGATSSKGAKLIHRSCSNE